jgi:CheY-like chemotaxis protein
MTGYTNNNRNQRSGSGRRSRDCWTILLVDSEPYSAQRVLLEQQGHYVVHSLRDDLALSFLQHHHHPYDIVIVHLDSTAFNGRQLLQRLLSLSSQKQKALNLWSLNVNHTCLGRSPCVLALSTSAVQLEQADRQSLDRELKSCGADGLLLGAFGYSTFLDTLQHIELEQLQSLSAMSTSPQSSGF